MPSAERVLADERSADRHTIAARLRDMADAIERANGFTMAAAHDIEAIASDVKCWALRVEVGR